MQTNTQLPPEPCGGQIAIVFEPRRAARRHDPETSKQAAENAAVFATSQAQRVLNALKRIGPSGKTRISLACGLNDVQVCRRLSELKRAGLALPTEQTELSASGCAELIWVSL